MSVADGVISRAHGVLARINDPAAEDRSGLLEVGLALSAITEYAEALVAQRDGVGDIASGTLWRAERDLEIARAEHAAQVTLRREALVQLEDANRRIDALETALRELADHGLRFDLTPTLMMTTGEAVYSQWAHYARRMDESVRAHAARALARSKGDADVDG